MYVVGPAISDVPVSAIALQFLLHSFLPFTDKLHNKQNAGHKTSTLIPDQ